MRVAWTKATIGELCQFKGGGTPSKAVKRYWQGHIPWISPKDMKSDVVSDSIDHISQEAIDGSAASLIPKGSVLIVVRSGILARTVPLAITAADVCINQDLKALCPDRTLDSNFLYYYLHSRMADLLALVSRGATVHRLITDHIRSLEILVPPLAEQTRLVAIFDGALEKVRRAQSNIDKAARDASELFDSALAAYFDSESKSWRTELLASVVDAECSLSYGIVQPGELIDNGLPIVRPTDLVGKEIALAGLKRIDPSLAQAYQRTRLRGNDLLLCVRGTTGMVSVACKELKDGNVTRGIVPINFKKAEIHQAFGYYLLKSPQVQRQIREKTYGTALMQINIGDLRKVRVSFPSLSDQGKIAEKLDSLHLQSKRLAKCWERKREAFTALKASLLHHALRGELSG